MSSVRYQVSGKTYYALRFMAYAFPVALYTVLSLYQLDLPGLHYDEAFEAVPALQLLQGQPVVTFRGHGLYLDGQTWPLMTQDYIGAINTYLALPFIAVLGPTPAALRIMSVLVGAVTLWLAYLLASRLTGSRWAGALTVLLLAVQPTFIFWNRQGIFVTAVTAPIGLAAAWCGLRRAQGGSWRWTAASAFWLGLGLYAKLLFVWLIAGLLGATILLNSTRFLPQNRKNISLKFSGLKNHFYEIIAVIVAFLAGCWPLVIYNLQTGGTLLSIAQNAGKSYYGVNNLNVLSNLAERFSQFFVVLNGGQFWYLGDIWSTSLPSLALGLFLVLVVYTTTRNPIRSTPSSSKTALFPYLVIILVILASSTGTVSALWPTHFALLMPWPAIALSVSIWFIEPRIPHVPRITHYGLRITLWSFIVLLIGVNLVNTLRYHHSLAESGGLSSHSDAVYKLSDWLDTHANGPVAAMDWGLAAPVTYLTAGRVTPTEVFGYAWESDAELTARLKSLIDQPTTLYLWRAPDEIIFDRSQEFKALYRPLSLEEDIEAAFYERNGRPILGVTRLTPRGTAKNPPQ